MSQENSNGGGTGSLGSSTSVTMIPATKVEPLTAELSLQLTPQLDGGSDKDKANVKFAVLIGLIEVGQVSNKEVVNTVLQLESHFPGFECGRVQLT
ncbi:unnamed protein product [Allacma fusca]|uniref:Neurobeachin n=1 Tax=Allacma fusca TaxID=39272 RepID=A0A8J2LFX4_9HEXA|nr:unnamed protein product [Allacma fusca]